MDASSVTPPELRVGGTTQLHISSMANGGAAIGRAGDLVIFVEGAIPGERVTVRITERHKNFARAAIVGLDERSPDRVDPPCPYFGRCGGCQWQHMRYETQVAAKTAIVRDQFRRGLRMSDADLDGAMRAPIQMADPWAYRNIVTVEPTVAGKPAYHHIRSSELVPIDHCPISQPAISAGLGALSEAGIAAETTIRQGADGAAVTFSGGPRKTVVQRLRGLPFRVSGGAFFQVNTRAADGMGGESMADLLAAQALEGLALTGTETVLDLYAGVGAFAILAAPHARRVIAVEEAPVAATDARYNAQRADARNVEMHTRTAEQLMPTLSERIDAAILDPPRSGCATAVVDGLLRLRPRRIVYVSCDVATLLRDLRLLRAAYDIASCQMIDMFPQTFHIETVTVLTLGGQQQ
jgi:23S rRNA (uracil1939-C5)-methyltransferase